MTFDWKGQNAILLLSTNFELLTILTKQIKCYDPAFSSVSVHLCYRVIIMGYYNYGWCILSSPCLMVHCVCLDMLNCTASRVKTDVTHGRTTWNSNGVLHLNLIYMFLLLALFHIIVWYLFIIYHDYTTPQGIPKNVNSRIMGIALPPTGLG